MINTYNETTLHRKLKELYAEKYRGTTEVEEDDLVCDVICDDEARTVIEIQTKGLGKLLPKILKLKDRHDIRVVHPLIRDFSIELYDEAGNFISRRKSPKHLSIIDVFDELMGIYPILAEPWFTLEIVPVSCIEKRIRTKEPVQLINRSRRFKKNWYKKDRDIRSMEKGITLNGLEAYLSLLPEDIKRFRHGMEFCAKDLEKAGCGKQSYKVLWLLKKTEIVKAEEKKGRTTFYKFSPEFTEK